MPDFDVDFCYERRDEVINYVANKYGQDHVSQIITFGTMSARMVIRDVRKSTRCIICRNRQNSKNDTKRNTYNNKKSIRPE